MNTENSKTNKPNRFRLDLTDKRNLKKPNKNMALVNLSIYYTWENITPEYNNNKFIIIIKKHETLTENPPIQIYPNKIKNRIVFKIKTGYKLGITPETMKLSGSAKKDVGKDMDCKNVPKLESVELVLVHCNLLKNDYQHTSKVLFTFAPNKQFGQLIIVSLHSLIMINTVNTEFSFLEVWFTDQASKVLEIEDNVNLTLIIG